MLLLIISAARVLLGMLGLLYTHAQGEARSLSLIISVWDAAAALSEGDDSVSGKQTTKMSLMLSNTSMILLRG